MSGSVESSAGTTPTPGGGESEIRPSDTTGLGGSALRFIALSVVSGGTFLLLSFLWNLFGPLQFVPLSEVLVLNPDNATQIPTSNFDTLPALVNQLLTATVVIGFVLFLVLMTLIALVLVLLVNIPIILLGGACLVSGLVFTLSLFGSFLFSLGHVLFALLGRYQI